MKVCAGTLSNQHVVNSSLLYIHTVCFLCSYQCSIIILCCDRNDVHMLRLCWNLDSLPHPGNAIGIILQLKKVLFGTEPLHVLTENSRSAT